MPRRKITLPRFAEKVAKLGPKLESAVKRGLQSAALEFSARVVQEIDSAEPFPAVDRGELRNSVMVRPTGSGAIVTVDAPHAAAIEHGTRPFYPPIEPIARWALRKGFVDDERSALRMARAIARKFAVSGLAPRHYFAKAWQRFERDGVLAVEIRRELSKLDLL